MLSLQAKNPGLCQSLSTLRDHNKERKSFDPDLWAQHEEKVAHFILNVCKMDTNVEKIHRAMGILKTNSANLDLPEGYGEAVAIYPCFAKINHSCAANTKNANNLPGHE